MDPSALQYIHVAPHSYAVVDKVFSWLKREFRHQESKAELRGRSHPLYNWDTVLFDICNYGALVAKHKHFWVAFLIVAQQSQFCSEIRQVYVSLRYRSRGIANYLIHKFINDSVQPMFYYLTSSVDAIPFYSHIGWRASDDYNFSYRHHPNGFKKPMSRCPNGAVIEFVPCVYSTATPFISADSPIYFSIVIDPMGSMIEPYAFRVSQCTPRTIQNSTLKFYYDREPLTGDDGHVICGKAKHIFVNASVIYRLNYIVLSTIRFVDIKQDQTQVTDWLRKSISV